MPSISNALEFVVDNLCTVVLESRVKDLLGNESSLFKECGTFPNVVEGEQDLLLLCALEDDASLVPNTDESSGAVVRTFLQGGLDCLGNVGVDGATETSVGGQGNDEVGGLALL